MELNDAVLMSAIKRDDVETIQKSFKRIDDVSNYVFEASVSSTNPVLDDHPPLVSVAAFFGASSILLDLLSKGVDISKRDDKHRSLGYFAVAGSRLSIVKLLAESHVDFSECGHLAAGLDPLTTDAFGCTLLHSTATSGTASIADFLLSLNVIDVNARDHEGNTPLHLAAYNGNTPVVNLLLKHPDVDLNPTNKKAKSILHLAAQKKNESLIQSILESAGIGNKDVEEIGTPAVSKALDLNPADTRGVTPLLEAIEADSIKNVRLLISIDGVDLNAKDKEGVCYFLTTLPFTTPHYGIAWML